MKPSLSVQKIHQYWQASNYLSVAQIYLKNNPLLKETLKPEHIKKMLLGHWGTCPGQNFIYTHLNRVINEQDLNMIYLSGPGHGGPSVVSHTYLEGTYSAISASSARTKPSPTVSKRSSKKPIGNGMPAVCPKTIIWPRTGA